MPVLQGGPADGQMFFDPRTDEAAPEAEDEETLFQTLMDTVNKLRGLGTVSEQTKLSLEKAATLLQGIRAEEEKAVEGAMQGQMTPALLRKANAPQGGPGGGPGY